ncbi:hypothetical protein [Paenibacillus alginolyticus]|nr:hypothetical protein [Paenibacillus alginolyticus]MEC0142726.1 hypothetical protein [Paenibacillus alginolyticus]
MTTIKLQNKASIPTGMVKTHFRGHRKKAMQQAGVDTLKRRQPV